MYTKIVPRAFTAVTLSAALLLAVSSVRAGGGFKDLFNGKDLTGWKVKLFGKGNPKETFQVKDGIIVVSGRPNGYFYTDESYKNFILKYDWRFKRPKNLKNDDKFGGNSGLLLHIQEHKRGWPACIEVQGMNRQHGRIFAIGGIKGANVKAKFYPDVLKEARNPVGEWNTTELLSQDGKIVAKVNGKVVAEAEATPLSGPFGFQSEGAELHFKDIKIKVLD